MSGYPRRGSLTDEQVVKIRVDYARGYKSTYQLGREYGLTPASITAIVQGSIYKSVDGPIIWPRGSMCVSTYNPMAARARQDSIPRKAVRGHCRDVACTNPIASSGWAQRMHMCERCFQINGGKRCGRAATGRMRTIQCAECHALIRYYSKRHKPKYCSKSCFLTGASRERMKRPQELTDARLHELYWGQNMTLPEIAAKFGRVFSSDAVRLWMVAANLPLRRPTRRTSSICVVDGCQDPVDKRWNGKVHYGRLCKYHWDARDRRRAEFVSEQRTTEAGVLLAEDIGRLVAGLPDSVRDEAASSIMLAALSGTLSLPLSSASVKPYIAAAFRENADGYKFLSIQAPASSDDGAQTWGERLGLS